MPGKTLTRWLRKFLAFAGLSSPQPIMDINTTKNHLKELSAGLLYFSESEYPLELLDWGGKSPSGVSESILAMHPSGSTIETLTITDFFQKLLRNLEIGGNDMMKEMGARYRKLQLFIEKNMASAQVLRCGKIEVGIYIVMQTKSGQVLVLKTTSIET